MGQTLISADGLDFRTLNERVKSAGGDVRVDNCMGQRFLCAGLDSGTVTVNGIPGNALGAYLDGGTVVVNGNAQDAVGDTMNGGRIIVHGSIGDAPGYAMRGGGIFVRGDAGYRAGIHMKAYGGIRPVVVIGGKSGSFLGEYLAGGLIIVLGIGVSGSPVGGFIGTGMHGGRIYIRSDACLEELPAQVTASIASDEELREIEPYVSEFAAYFDLDAAALIKDSYYVIKPNAKNPYKQMYTANA